jgi:hypothetical protein
LVIISFPRQQNSFGKKQEKRPAWEMAKGIATFCTQCVKAASLSGKKIAALPFFLIVRKGPRRQRSISADLTFWLLLGQAKSNSLRGN